jgi:DNA-binding GntR family transcriptional regulator
MRTRRGDTSSLRAYIRERIIEGIKQRKFEPGTRIVENEIAERLKVSRTPVREAMLGLIADGYLVALPSRGGVVVNKLDREQLAEFFAVREVLEVLAAQLATQFLGEADIEYLELLLTRSEEAEGDPEKQDKYNSLFHEVIQKAAHNRYLIAALNSFQSTLSLFGETTYSMPNRPAHAHAEHRALIEAFRKRDPQLAGMRAAEHIKGSAAARLRKLFERS